MQAVLLAGGVGRRVFPLSTNNPKPMFKILGKPLIVHAIENLKEAGLNDIVVVVGPNGDPIKQYLKDGTALGVNVQYSFQKEPLGMANAIEAVGDKLEDNFFVVNADDIFEAGLLKEMINKFRKGKAQALLSCKPVKETWKYGIIQKQGERVTHLVEKPPKGTESSNLAVIGVYLLTKKILSYYEKVGVSDHQYEDAIDAFIQEGNNVEAVNYDGFFAGYKYPWDLFAINQHLINKKVTERKIQENVSVSERAEIIGNVWLSSGVRVMSGACINGPAYIGPNSVIGNNALIRNSTSIGANCTVGFATEIKRSIIGDNCLFHMNFVGDSIISDSCLFGAGSITGNFRFDGNPVAVMVDGKKVDTGDNKIGVIMGEKCEVGINASLSPGVKVGPSSIVGPGVTLKQDLAQGMAIFVEKENYKVAPNKLISR